jgi:hypothetical protein
MFVEALERQNAESVIGASANRNTASRQRKKVQEIYS